MARKNASGRKNKNKRIAKPQLASWDSIFRLAEGVIRLVIVALEAIGWKR